MMMLLVLSKALLKSKLPMFNSSNSKMQQRKGCEVKNVAIREIHNTVRYVDTQPLLQMIFVK